MKTYKTDAECEELFHEFIELSKTGNGLFQRIHDAATIVQNPGQTVTEEELKRFFTQMSSIIFTLEGMVVDLEDLYGDVGVYIDEREIK